MAATVSILLPTYEPKPEHLREAIDSVLRQSYSDWMLFIHDDASEISTEEIVRPYLTDPRITFQRSDRRLGIGGNWNACLKEAFGEYVQFLFQDDLWHPDYLLKATAAMESDPAIGLVSVNHSYRCEGENAKQFYEKARFESIKILKKTELTAGHQSSSAFLTWWINRGLRPNVIGEPSFVMLRKSVTDRVRKFREDIPQGLDLEYWLRVLLITDWYYLKDDLGTFRVHADGASLRNDEEGLGLYDRLTCYEVLLQSLPSGDTKVAAKRAVREQLSQMIKKFRNRVHTGNRVSGRGSKSLFGFALRHPLLLAQSVVDAMARKND